MDREVRLIVNAVAFYAAWFVIALAAAKNAPVIAAGAGLAVVALHLWLSEDWKPELRLVLWALGIGFVVETLLLQLGITTFASADTGPNLPPTWMLTLWMAFATVLNISFGWLKPRLGFAAALGILGGPLSYFAGARLGAMAISHPVWPHLLVIGLLWAIAFPLLLWLARGNERAS